MTQWADNHATVGCIQTISTTVTDAQMKSAVKTKMSKTNNQASICCNLLKNKKEVAAAMELSLHLDETGLIKFCSVYSCRLFKFAHSSCLLKICSVLTRKVSKRCICTKFTLFTMSKL